MALALIDFGSVARSAQVNPIINLLQGTAGVSQAVQLIQWDHATTPTLTLKNLHATGTALSIKDSAGTEQIKIHRQVSSNDATKFYETINLGSNGKLVSRSDGTAPIHSHLWDFYRSDAEAGTILLEVIYDNEWLGTQSASDAATVAFLGRRLASGAGGYFRTMELDAINLTGTAMTQPWIGIEATVQATVAGNGSDMSVGFALYNMGELWEPGASWDPIDTGLLMGDRSTHRITNFVRFMGNGADGNGSTVLFNIDYTGKVLAGDVYPRTDSAYDLGSVSVNWRYSWVDTYHSTLGISTTLAHYELGATNTGFGLVASNTIGVFNNSTETFRIDAAGNVICGTTGLATNATDGFFYIRQGAGAPTGAPSIGSGRAALYVDATNHKFYFHDGSGWVVTN